MHWRVKHRGQPDDIDSEGMQVRDFSNYARNIAPAIAVGVVERGRIYLEQGKWTLVDFVLGRQTWYTVASFHQLFVPVGTVGVDIVGNKNLSLS